MGEKTEVEARISRFEGMGSIADPGEIKLGLSTDQVNVHSLRFGELTVRDGLKEITFDES